jgi:hypothetical protein
VSLLHEEKAMATDPRITPPKDDSSSDDERDAEHPAGRTEQGSEEDTAANPDFIEKWREICQRYRKSFDDLA